MYNPFSTNVFKAERLKDGSWFYNLMGSNSVSSYTSESEKLKAILSNPAALKVFKLQCDTFSLGMVSAKLNGKPKENDPLYLKLKSPNPFQSQRQFLWDYMFWNMLGTAYLHPTSKVLNENTKLYWLDPSRLEWTDTLLKKLDKIVLSKQYKNDLERLSIRYCNLDGSYNTYKLSEIIPFFDLSNGFGNWYKGASTVDALYKVISNSNAALDAKAINLEFVGKFFVTGQHKEADIYGTPMTDTEKDSVENSIRSNKPVHAIKTMADIKRFVDDLGKQELDKAYRESYFTIGNMYGIPRDVLEAFEGSTFENQEKARGSHVEYCLKHKGQDLMEGVEKLFGYDTKNINLNISWNHLSFMQVFEQQRASVKASQLANLKSAQEMSILSENEIIEIGREIIQYD